MNGFNKGKSEKTLKEKKKKLNGKEALECQPVEWEEIQHKKECERSSRERGKYEWDRPLVDESWTIDDENKGRTAMPAAPKAPAPKEDVSEFERKIINSTIMEDEELFMHSARVEHGLSKSDVSKGSLPKPGVPYMKEGQESIYDKFAKEDEVLEKELAGKLDAVGSMAASKTDVRAIKSSVDNKIIIQSEELKHKRTSNQDAAGKKKIRRRVPKGELASTEKLDKRGKQVKKDGISAKTNYTPSKFREKSANWKDSDENLMLDGEGLGAMEFFQKFFGKFAHFSPLQWATVIMAIIIFITGITTTAVYASYQSEQNKAVAIASLSKFEEEDTEVVEAMVVDEEMPLAAEAPEEQTGKILSLVLTSVEKDLKIKLVDEDDTLVKGVPWGVTVTDADGKTSENEDDDEDGIIHLTDVSAGDYSVQLNPNDALADYVLPSETQSVSVKAKVEYKVIQNIKDEIKTEKEVNAAAEDANGNQAADVETGTAPTDTVEWVESTKTANGETYVESAVVLANTAKAPVSPNNFVAALDMLKSSASTGVLGSRVIGFPVLLVSENEAEPPSEPVPTYNVTVNGGSGGGSYKAGEKVSIAANEPESGKQFSGWSANGVSLGDSSSKSTSFTMPSGDVTVTANYAEIPVTKYKVVVNNGTGGGEYAANETVTITANPASTGKKFKTWTGNAAFASATNSQTTFTMPAGDVTVTAEYEDEQVKSLSLDKSSVSIKVNDTAVVNATVSPAAAVTWTSDNTSVATVTGSGTNSSTCTIKGIKAGTATIKAAANGIEKTCTVTITAAETPAVNLKGTASVAIGSTTKITAEVVPSSTTVEWSISDKSIATIAADGLNCTVTGVKTGSVKLTAKGNNGKSATLTITVTAAQYADGAQLYDKDKNALYVFENNAYRLAKYSDYKSGKFSKYYKKVEGYLYTGWQTIDGKTYYYKKDNTYVTGEQTIAGVKYNFATDGSLTQGSGTLGIDVSKYQPSINWASVKASGVSYAIIRCGYRGSSTGALIQDPYFVSHIKGAKAAGLKVGVYFFTTALTEAEAVEEASMCAALCSGYGINYPVFMDVESSNRPGFNSMSASQRTAIIQAFCNTVKSAGYTPGVYANKTWLTSYMNASALSGYKIWLAQYNANGPTYNGRYDLWQYTSKGSVSGISGNVDMNQSYLGY